MTTRLYEGLQAAKQISRKDFFRGYTADEVRSALQLRARGWQYGEIAAETGIPKTTVFRWCKRYLEEPDFRAAVNTAIDFA